MNVNDWIDLPELFSIQMGYHAFFFKASDVENNTVIMRSLEMSVE